MMPRIGGIGGRSTTKFTYSNDPQTYEINRSMYTYYSATPVYANQPYQSGLQSISPSKTQLTQPAPTVHSACIGREPALYGSQSDDALRQWENCSALSLARPCGRSRARRRSRPCRSAIWSSHRILKAGELAYKPVIQVTKGPVLPLVEIHTGEETIRCTYGHLFWVSGTGWRMAKELKVGDRLHTTKGTLTIDNVEKTVRSLLPQPGRARVRHVLRHRSADPRARH